MFTSRIPQGFYSLDKKVEVVKRHKKGESIADLITAYKIPYSTLYKWTQIADELIQKSRDSQKKVGYYLV